MFTTLIGYLCSALCTALLTVGGGNAPYSPYATHPVFFAGSQVGVYVDDTQANQCTDVIADLVRWKLVIAGDPPGRWPRDKCPGALNALEWGQYWGPPPPAYAYILESSTLGPLTSAVPVLTRQALRYRPRIILYWSQPLSENLWALPWNM